MIVSSRVTSGGMKEATTASTAGSANVLDKAATNSSPVACGASVRGPLATSSPQLTQASAASVLSASELPTMPTRGPPGRGWLRTSWAMSNI